MKLPAPRSDFIGLEGTIHLASGGQPPLLTVHRDAFEAFAEDKSTGMDGYFRHWEVADRVRSKLAGLLNLDQQDIALLGNASEGIGRVISTIDWQAGDNVVTADIDYASGRFALSQLTIHDVELRLVPAQNWFVDPEEILNACDQQTRLVYLSHVNAHTGQKIDLHALSEPLAERGILFLVDASHSLGVLPVDARACDFLVSCTYKFLLGPHLGVLAWNKDRWPEFEPFNVGRFSARDTQDPGSYVLHEGARRAEVGNVNHVSIYMLERSLNYLSSFSGDEVESHVLDLGGRLWKGMNALGCPLITPKDMRDRGPNVCMLSDAPKALTDLAAAKNIILWGDTQRLRVSLHVFSTIDDVDDFLTWLPQGISQTKGVVEADLWS